MRHLRGDDGVQLKKDAGVARHLRGDDGVQLRNDAGVARHLRGDDWVQQAASGVIPAEPL
jgi:hypothetical protein